METMKQGVLPPSETKHARSTQEPEKAGISQETSCCRHGWRGGWGWEGGQWRCPHHLRGSTSFPVHFQRRAGNTEHCLKPSPLQEPLAWDELRDAQRPPCQVGVSLPKGRTLLHCQHCLWNLPFHIHADGVAQLLTIILASKKYGLIKEFFFAQGQDRFILQHPKEEPLEILLSKP